MSPRRLSFLSAWPHSECSNAMLKSPCAHTPSIISPGDSFISQLPASNNDRSLSSVVLSLAKGPTCLTCFNSARLLLPSQCTLPSPGGFAAPFSSTQSEGPCLVTFSNSSRLREISPIRPIFQPTSQRAYGLVSSSHCS